MQLEFHYNAKNSGIEKHGDDLRISLVNPSFGQSTERWTLPSGVHAIGGDFHKIVSHDYALGAASVKICPDNLAETAESLYEQLLSDHPEFSLYRIWHFVPGINERPEGHLENYQSFCVGRATAFERHAEDALHSKMPAASAVGTTDDHLTVVYLAGRPLGKHLENPRQTPAYHYPEQYGPKPPAFARATSVEYARQPTLFVSGTASVLASESIGDTIESQLATTVENLHLVASRSPDANRGRRRVRVYLRHPQDYDYVKKQLNAHYLHDGDEAFYLQADICREELLVEIEVTCGL